MALPASDTFTAADNTVLTTYNASWTFNAVQQYRINTNAVYDNASGVDFAAHWNADTFGNDQYAQATLTALGGDQIGVSARVAGSVLTYYGFYTAGAGNTTQLARMISGTWTQLGSNGTVAWATSDVIRIEVSGASPSISVRPMRNGTTYASIGTQTDSSIATGSAGITSWSGSTATREDSWEGGNLAASGALVGSAAGVTSQTGTLTATGVLVGTVANVASQTAALRGAGALAGSSAGIATQTGTLTSLGSDAAAGSAAGIASQSGTLTGAGALVGSVAASATQTGTLAGAGVLSATASGTATQSGTLTGTGALVATATGTATADATLLGAGALNGTSAGVATAEATAQLPSGGMAGSITSTAAGSATLLGAGALDGTSAGVMSYSATLTELANALYGSAVASATATATITASGILIGSVLGTGTISGLLYDSSFMAPGARDALEPDLRSSHPADLRIKVKVGRRDLIN